MDAGLDLRAVVLLVAASAAFTALSPAVYRRDPARRRIYLAALAAVLLLVPWWSFAGLWTWPLGVEDPGRWLAQPVPWLLVWLWWAAGGALVLRTLVRVAGGRRRLNALPPFAPGALAEELREVAAALDLRTPVALHLGPSPCASTLGRARLVLPAVAHHWPRAARLAVLGHELAHVKRRDDRWLLLVRLLVDWYWWMPWLARLHDRFVEAMEESCDDAASRAVGDRAAYVEGLVLAARSLRRAAGDAPDWPAWVSLLGHSHLTVRAERLLSRPRPTLDHADGRWALLWASLTLVVLLTARPSAIPDQLPATADLLPLRPLNPEQSTRAPSGPRVESRSYLQPPAGGAWLLLPVSAREPRPVYPAGALARGIAGTVTVELDVSAGPSGWFRRGTPNISSNDPTGLLEAAVARAYARTGDADVDAGLRALSAHNETIDAIPPGTTLRLRRTYRFVPGTAARPANDSTGGSEP